MPTFDPIFAKDPGNPNNIAANATITIYDPADTTKTPIALTKVDDTPLSNPITVDRHGMGPAFKHDTLYRVAWEGGGLTNYFTSYEQMHVEAVEARTAASDSAVLAQDAQAAAQAAAASAATDAVAEVQVQMADAQAAVDASAADAAAAAALVDAPADDAVETLINSAGTKTNTALSATIASAVESDVTVFVAAGDSITEGNQDGTGTTYPALLDAALPSAAITNLGKSGWTSTEIAHRFGYPFKLAAFTAPSGAGQANSVQVTPLFPTGVYRESVNIFPSWLGELRFGSTVIPGRLRHTIDGGAAISNAWTFERTTAGDAVAVPEGADFVSTEFDHLKNATFLISAGRNNTADPSVVVRDINAIIEQLPAKATYLVLSVTTSVTETSGTTGYLRIKAVNDALLAEYGPRFVDDRRYIIDRGLAINGLTPTQADLDAQAADTIPPALLVADGLHPNQYGYKARAQAVLNKLPSRGWLRATPLAIPGVDVDAAQIDPAADSADFRWLADDLTAADGTAVASWPAKAGGIDLTGTGAAQPTIITTSGKKYVRFDGVDDMLVGASIGITQPSTILVRAKVRTLGTSFHGLVWSQVSPGMVMAATPSGYLRVGATNSFNSATGPLFTEGVDSVFVGVFDGASSSSRVDGSAVTTGDIGTGGMSTMRVGYAYDSAARYAAIDVAEIRVYSKVLTQTEIDTYMAEMNA